MGTVFNLHLDSIRNVIADPKVLGYPDASKPGGLGPHYVTRRYAEFISAIHSLNPENNQQIRERLAALRVQMQKLLRALINPPIAGRKNPQQQRKDNHKQSVFFINNIDQILSVLSNRKLNVEDGEKWKSLLEQYIASFVELELSVYFKKLRFCKNNNKCN